jgi:nitroreductase
MLASAHVIEKGMSLPSPRLGYGQQMLKSLIDLSKKYESNGYDLSAFPYVNAKAVLGAYYDYHVEMKHDLGEIGQEIRELSKDASTDAGCMAFSNDDYRRLAQGDFRSCAQSRYSIRAFSREPVPESKVTEALEIARKTPSVCNRQSWHTYWVRSKDAKQYLGELQNGHRGFGDQVDSFLVITTDLHSFFGVGERNQSFVDGGLYAMSLLYALHYVGVGACPLNWCMPANVDKKLRARIDIPLNENIVLVIAIGALPEKIRAAQSVRKSVADTLLIR